MSDSSFFFDSDKLLQLATRQQGRYLSAAPFPHGVFDGFMPADELHRVLDEFPGPDDIEWQSYDAQNESGKLACGRLDVMGPHTRNLLVQLNSAPVIDFLERLTGIEGLVPDPHFSGAGLFQTMPGGYLDLHADFNWNPRLKLDRRVNLIIQLNDGWQEEWGGHLELWDSRVKVCHERVLPIFNRCTIFSPTSSAWHGHPEPLACPEGQSRKSVAAFYYTNGRPLYEQRGHHTTIFHRSMRSADRKAKKIGARAAPRRGNQTRSRQTKT